MRNMSFAATIGQMRDKSKTVTRRQGWLHLKPGDLLCAVERAMGIGRGEMVRIGVIEILSVTREPLSRIEAEDVTREGYPGEPAAWFVERFCGSYGGDPDQIVTRIEFCHRPDLDLSGS